MTSSQKAENPRSLVRYAIIMTAFTIIVFVISWLVSDALLLIFAGLLFAAFLDAMTRLLGEVIGWPRWVRLTIVCTLLATILVGALAWGGAAIATQGSQLATTLENQANQVLAWFGERGITLPFGDNSPDGSERTQQGNTGAAPTIRSVLPGVGGIFGQAWTAVAMVLGVLGDALIIIFLGLFVALKPNTYRDAVLLLFPPEKREKLLEVFNESGETLRSWLLGQSLTMLLIGIFVWLGLMLVGVEPAVILGLQAGLLAFVPTLGPLLAGVAILLASLAFGLWGVIGALCVYLLVQMLESYILTPVIQKRAISVPPAFLFASQITLGLLFGIYGLALATPLAAVVRVFILRLYVQPMSASRN